MVALEHNADGCMDFLTMLMWRCAWSMRGCRRGMGGERSGEQRQVSEWQSWHTVTNHSLPLYAVACWTSNVESLGERAVFATL